MGDLIKKDQDATDTIPGEDRLSPMIGLVMSGKLDPGNIDQLLSIQERYERNESVKAFNIAKAKFKANAPTIKKGANVSYGGTSYNYVKLGYALATINPVLSEFGLSLSWRTNQNDSMVTVTAVLTHELGHSEESTLAGPYDNSGKKNTIQALASTVTYLKRHTAFAILGLEGVDDDDGVDHSPHYNQEPLTQQQIDSIKVALEESGRSEEKLLRYYQSNGFKGDSIDQIPKEWYESAMEMIKRARS